MGERFVIEGRLTTCDNEDGLAEDSVFVGGGNLSLLQAERLGAPVSTRWCVVHDYGQVRLPIEFVPQLSRPSVADVTEAHPVYGFRPICDSM
jgi:hypothetical protein